MGKAGVVAGIATEGVGRIAPHASEAPCQWRCLPDTDCDGFRFGFFGGRDLGREGERRDKTKCEQAKRACAEHEGAPLRCRMWHLVAEQPRPT